MDLESYKQYVDSLNTSYGIQTTAAMMSLMDTRSINVSSTMEDIDNNKLYPYRLEFDIYNRTITIGAEITDIVVAGDTNSRIITFRLNRYFDGIDLTTKNIRIYYANAEKKTAYAPVSNLLIDEENALFTIDWLIDGKTTISSGIVTFLIDFYQLNETNEIIYRWQTTPTELDVVNAISKFESAEEPDYSIPIEFYNNNIPAFTYEYLYATESTVEIENRTIIMPSIENLVVKKDTMSRALEFRIPRYFDGTDLSQKVIAIKYINVNGDGDRSRAINIKCEKDSDEILFTWAIDGKATVKEGKVAYAIEFIGYDEHNNFYCWQTIPSYIFVENGLIVDSMIEQPRPSWIQSWEIHASQLILEAKYYLDISIQMNQEILNELETTKDELSKLTENYEQLKDNLKETLEKYDKAADDYTILMDEMNKVLDSIKKNSLNNIDIIMLLSADLIQEKGNVIMGTEVSWSFNPNFIPLEQYINGYKVNANALNYIDINIITEDKAYVLVVKDAVRTISQTLYVKFFDSIRWTSAPITEAINSSFILNMPNYKLQEKARGIFTLDCNNKEYIYFAYPSYMCDNIKFYITSIEGGFQLAAKDIEFTNQYGHIENYNIYRSCENSLGSITVGINNIPPT